MRSAWLLTCLFACAVAGLPAHAAAFDAARPGWTVLEFTSSKMLLSATARVEAQLRPSTAVAGELVGTPVGVPVVTAAEVVELTYTAQGLGRSSVTKVLADARSGAVLQSRRTESGSRLRTWRYTDIGAWHYTRRPASGREAELDPSQWTDVSEGLRPYPAGASGATATEATMLLWLAAASDLDTPGERMEVIAFSRRNLHRVGIEVTGTRRARIGYQERSGSGTRTRSGETDALVLRLQGLPFETKAGEEPEPFELLGLQGDLELLLEPRARIPLQLRGRVKVLGDLTIRLKAATLRQ